MTIIRNYRAWLLASGASVRTVEARVGGARRLMALASADDPATLTTMDALAYIASVPAKASRATYYQHVRSFARFLEANGGSGQFAKGIPVARFPRGVPRPADANELSAAIAQARPDVAMMLRLAAFAGLRVSEIANMHGEDLDGDNLYITGKGGRREMIPAHISIVRAAARFPRQGWWFPAPSDSSRPMRRWTVWDLMTRALRAVGSVATPHQCRHLYGTALLESGADLRTVQTLLRHASLATTAIYTQVTDDRRRAAIAALPSLT